MYIYYHPDLHHYWEKLMGHLFVTWYINHNFGDLCVLAVPGMVSGIRTAASPATRAVLVSSSLWLEVCHIPRCVVHTR